jgi:hypothetical protein
MKKVYQVWEETSVGPTFASRQEALTYLGHDSEESFEDTADGYWDAADGYDYPDIREIILGEDTCWDR